MMLKMMVFSGWISMILLQSLIQFMCAETSQMRLFGRKCRLKTNGKDLMETKEILKLKKFLNYRGYEFQDIDKAFSEFNRENL